MKAPSLLRRHLGEFSGAWEITGDSLTVLISCSRIVPMIYPARRLLLTYVVEPAVMQPSGTMYQLAPRARLANADDRALLVRIRAEFTEMPGLSLTLAQASRLFDVEVRGCEQILASLVKSGQLAIRGKRFVRK